MNAPSFNMRPLTWTLLSLLIIVILVVFAPNIYGDQRELLQGIGIFIALIVLLVGMILVRLMNKRLARLATVAEAIGQGDYDSRAEDKHDDAIGLLAHAINRMATEIQDVVAQLETQQMQLQDNRQRLEEQNARLSLEYQRQSSFGEYLESLNTVDINTIANKGLDYLMRVGRAQLGQIYVRDSSSGKLLKLSENGIDRTALGKLVDGPPEHGFPGEILTRGENILIEQIDEHAFPMINLGFAAVRLRSVLGLPIVFQEQALGVVVMGALHMPDKNDLRLVNTVADALGSALNNALTYKTVQQQALYLKQANRELLEADRLRSEFVANMSHELRTPLNSIIGFSGVMMKNRHRTLAEKDLNYVEKINRNGKHLLSLINDILDLSKIEAGRMDPNFEMIDIAELARETVEMLHSQAEARDIRLQLEVADDLPQIRTDGEKLKQVLINLIGNAIKFTHQGGVKVNLRKSGSDSLTIDVIDTGIGIVPEKMETIFEPFRQVDSSTTRHYGGTGLGLAISRSIAELLGARIAAESVPGEGSMFSVQLPLTGDVLIPTAPAQRQDNPQTTANPPAANAAQPADAKMVLIIDDDHDARELLSRYVEDMGAHALAIGDSEQALAWAHRHRPDLITLDLMMPGVGGWEVLRLLKADPELRDIPVVVISIVAERRKALVLGAMDALSKPIAPDELIAILRRTLHEAPKGRLLVVDDNADVRDLFKQLLSEEVAEIRTANNGQEALEILESYQPDLIFLDLMMPKMDGLSFLRALRSTEKLQNLPVAIITAKHLSDAERDELEARAVQIIRKGEDSLEGRLREALGNALEG